MVEEVVVGLSEGEAKYVSCKAMTATCSAMPGKIKGERKSVAAYESVIKRHV